MREALDEARRAGEDGDVPVGCVVVMPELGIVGRGRNRREAEGNPLLHAEVMALNQAAGRQEGWRLSEATVYVTLEPCVMCAGAIVNARVRRLVYGALDPKAGGAASLYRICSDTRLNHRMEVVGGILREECSAVLRSFFEALRGK
ncbi:MAG: tRNA-specific adenosine deaminase [Candidatus Wallbacteria bacterium HGW-Wallbacteria-1]|jgi:tRNA(adenine34) deaminase|uniref:tRNA-specific adenosine deaminase n=1 Tax=Candidatus Wallbacteria bacterium HGW-Wallbacteria-1 TaxID=2013854 RepID=A0A2N1PVI6_9BACT|nr:MAG: tRNA-specific adenosine deaminase [Candidatus Wallbacteria bacterium HGW-Wallbacteria-1]